MKQQAPLPSNKQARPDLTRSDMYNGQQVPMQNASWPGSTPPSEMLALGGIQNPLPPQQSINCVRVPPGLKPQIVASELTPGPDATPFAYLMHFTFDERGRIWAVDTRDYPYTHNSTHTSWSTLPTGTSRLTQGQSRIVILEDTNGDGAMNHFKVFYSGLVVPGSIEVVNGGVITTVPPYVLFIPNLGNDVAGTPQILVSNMGSTGAGYDTHGQPSNLTYGLDNWIYGHTGYNQCGGTGVTIAGGTASGNCGSGNIWRFKHTAIGSDTTLFEVYGTGGPANAWGIGQMEDGQWFKSGATGTSHSNHQVRPGIGATDIRNASGGPGTSQFYAFTPDLYLWEGGRNPVGDYYSGGSTAVSGHGFYTSRLLPQRYWNRFAFACQGATKQCNQDSLVVNGGTWAAHRLYPPNRIPNIFASRDAWTAPLMARTGPDGGIWVADWYNYLFLHNPAGPSTNAAWQSPLRAKSRTRLYRIIPENGATEPVLDLSQASDAELVATFWNPNFHWRLHAQRLLIGKTRNGAQRAALLDMLEDVLRNNRRVDAAGINGPVLHALWTAEGMKEFRADSARWNPVLKDLLLHPAWTVRRNVPIAMPATGASYAALREHCAVNDSHPHVRVQALHNLARIPVSGSLIQSVSGLRSDNHITGAYTHAGGTKVGNATGSDRPLDCPAYFASGPDSVAFPVEVASLPPGPPASVIAMAGNSGEVVLTWQPPAFTGGTPITGYTVTAAPGGATCAWTTGNYTCAVAGLANGTPYTFTITATNGGGTGPSSNPVGPITPTNAPAQRPSIRYEITEAMVEGVAINTLLPISTGGPVTGYSAVAPLPAGLILDATSGAIMGTPSQHSPAVIRQIIATGPGGSDTAVVGIVVNPRAPRDLYYDPVNVAFPRDAVVEGVVPTVTGVVTTWSIEPPLPAGLVFNTTDGSIVGIALVVAPPTIYNVTAANATGSVSASVRIEITEPAGIRPGAGAFRVNGQRRSYAFALPDGTTGRATLTITDLWGRTIWSATSGAERDDARVITWSGRTATGAVAAPGMYVARVAVDREGAGAARELQGVILLPE